MPLPHVLIGECTSHVIVDLCRRLGWARMWVFRKIRPIEGERWGFDCGAFKAWSDLDLWVAEREGVRHLRREEVTMWPQDFDEAKYLRRIERAEAVGVPYLAVAPDLVLGGVRSLDFSLSWRPRLPATWPVYLAVQDGMTEQAVRAAVVDAAFAGIFLGGSSSFKATASSWARLARELGVRFHYARCSSQRQWRDACFVGADSVDSSQALWRAQMRTAWVNTTAQGEML